VTQPSYRQRLFAAYHETHVKYLEGDEQTKLLWFRRYAEKHYLPYITHYGRATATVLDIGCNRGYLLAALATMGFQRLYGIDLSPADVARARIIAPQAAIDCIDAFAYLAERQSSFDIILIKAVLEHIPKQEVIPLLEHIEHALKPGGLVMVDVPNMDWLFAPHERYMDFTHEVGFTRESLRQVMANVFFEVTVAPVDNIFEDAVLVNLKKKIGRYLLGKLLKWADPQGASAPIWARSLIGVGIKDREHRDSTV
jgi:2-polyprenyl-3-methyl-5-hydroxy-6-metoxy-1,4-benzoquinol methylase